MTRTRMNRVAAIAMSVLLAPACGGDDGDGAPEASATADFVGTNGQTVAGTATFALSDGEVSLEVEITDAPAGTHGMHIHLVPSCGNEGMDAGPHWDPVDTAPEAHDLPPGGHMGDLGNIEIGAAGTGTLTASNAEWTLGDDAATDVVPHAIIFHEMMDDGTMPSAGARWGCALIMLDE